ncbi:hypothetical protein [Arthrobacter castelli]|uniref:hypothetical protein n=1 Tax=Arthrobacter castelli TaxID=271431 RepID=UPI00138AE0D9|nr:hypothetical protein [Arthrobacter castelli]
MALTACGGSGGGGGVTEDPDGSFSGVYSQQFHDDIDGYTGQEVTLTSQVRDNITPMFFAIGGTDDSGTDVTGDALLVVHDGEVVVTDGAAVEVTGTVQESFDVSAVEEELGTELNLSALENWEGAAYVDADDVQVLDT